jgi:hypothetical protein
MNDLESHLLTKLKKSLKLGARTKLGKALLDANMPMKISELEYFEMMKDRSEWMPDLQ